MSIEEYWDAFKKVRGDDSLQYLESFHFELREDICNYLLALVLEGKKQATASSLLAYGDETCRMPQKGDFSIVTDWDGNPRCVIETTNVSIIPFNEITFAVCKREGEDDCLESWQKGHRKFFKAEGELLGYTYTEDMPVVFEDFKVVYK